MINPANPDCIILPMDSRWDIVWEAMRILEKGLEVRELTVDEAALIDLIQYYRDEYHKADWCHSDMIKKIEDGVDQKTLDLYWRITDDWLDY